MEINLYCSTHTGRTISEKTMEDGNNVNITNERTVKTTLASFNGDQLSKWAANGHEFGGEGASPPTEAPRQSHAPDDRKRINPLRIHLGKRPFVDNSPPQYNSSCKRKRPYVNKPSDINAPAVPRVPKLIPKRIDYHKFHNVSSQPDNNAVDSEKDKPVPRLVPKSQLLHFKKGKAQKSASVKDNAQNLGLQPMVKFKCRKCCSMSFKTLAMLKEHQLVCRAQAKEPALSPETAPTTAPTPGGPSRVTRKVYLCSACGTYYENWNLFLHMREVHNRHICLFCLGMFSKAEKLSAHLSNKHNVKEAIYGSRDEFVSVYNGTLYLMCCVCEEICSEQDDFFNHDCNNVKPKPVPVLVSKSTIKSNNNLKVNKQTEPVNGPSNLVKPEPLRTPGDKSEFKPESSSQQHSLDTNKFKPVASDTSIKDNSATTSQDSGLDIDGSKLKNRLVHYSLSAPENGKGTLPNGADTVEHSDEDTLPDEPETPEVESHQYQAPEVPASITPIPSLSQAPPIEKEREVGIKLKLSLNNAKSPVIINSTVDPTIGKQNLVKSSRRRRPPKKYSKEKLVEPETLPRTPSIKMTICDKADTPFVKTTIYENHQETSLKSLLNNNLESVTKSKEVKSDNTIKSTIYDNKIEESFSLENSMNRVPKLTVRVPKELLDKDSSSDYSSDSDVSDKLTVDENNATSLVDETKPKEESISEPHQDAPTSEPKEPQAIEEAVPSPQEEQIQVTDENVEAEPKPEAMDQDVTVETNVDEPPPPDEVPVIELTLDKPLDKYPLKELLRVFLSTTIFNCIYCNHARKIAVNCEQLCLHIVSEHRFSATVDSITAEELLPETIQVKVTSRAEEVRSVFINLESYDSEDKCEDVQHDSLFECFQCYFKTAVHKDLYLHNRKMHQKTILLCVMCKSNFYTYSELLCHLCPGAYDSEYEMKFRCCFCNVDTIPSSFRLMVHLRKIHHTCDVCLEHCHSQARLSNHVWKHKLHHLCYRCGIAYRNKPDITNHLFWKHGTQSVLCKRCLQKKWPHVYHFCTPPAIFVCEECSLQFTKAVYLKVHKRFHSGELPYECSEEGCTEKFVSKKLLAKHSDDHRKKIFIEDLNAEKPAVAKDSVTEEVKDSIPIIDLVDDKPTEEAGSSEIKAEVGTEQSSKKKKKKSKLKDALMLDVNLPELNLSESDSSDESDSGETSAKEEKSEEVKDEKQDETLQEKPAIESDILLSETKIDEIKPDVIMTDESKNDVEMKAVKEVTSVSQKDKKVEPAAEEKPNEQAVLEIWDNFKKYQEQVEKPKEETEKPKEKTMPLVPIRKHVCDSDHDYCLLPTEINGDDDMFSSEKKKSKKSPKKKHDGLSSSSSSSSDSDSSCSCGSNCSCSSSSGSSTTSSSDSDSSHKSGNEKKKSKQMRKKLSSRRLSNGSNVDVTGASETPILIPEKLEPPVAETDLETDESDTDEEFYDDNPQKIANELHAEKRNQLMLLASVATDGGSASCETSRPSTPMIDPQQHILEQQKEKEEKSSSSKKKSKKKKKKSSRRHGPIRINIPKDIIGKSESGVLPPTSAQNKITISLQSNTVHIPEAAAGVMTPTSAPMSASGSDSKRSSKRRRVPNKFYGYSSDEESSQSTTTATLKPQQPPKLEWRKEDLPSPVTHKPKKEIPTTVLTNRLYNYSESIRLTAPIPDPEPPRILMNSESMESSNSDSSDEGGLRIYQPHAPPPIPPPSYLNSGTSSLPYAFQRPAARQAREGESVYCYCRCPYDEVSEMIACDAEGCPIEWFHFECVGIMVPPKGKWYCPECRKNQSIAGYR